MNAPWSNAEMVSRKESVYLSLVEGGGRGERLPCDAGVEIYCWGRISRAMVEGWASLLIGLARVLDAGV